jgi:mRNA interferase MazF
LEHQSFLVETTLRGSEVTDVHIPRGADQTFTPEESVNQYEIWRADLPKPVGRRPVLLLSRPTAYAYLNKITVAEITTTVRDIPQEVSLGPPEGLSETCVANLDNLHVIPKRILRDLVGVLSPSREPEVKRALGYALGWPELKIL